MIENPLTLASSKAFFTSAKLVSCARTNEARVKPIATLVRKCIVEAEALGKVEQVGGLIQFYNLGACCPDG